MSLKVDQREVRDLLGAVLRTPDDFLAFCMDAFPETHARFGSGMNRVAQTNLLFEQNDAADVLEKLRTLHPAEVAQALGEEMPEQGRAKAAPPHADAAWKALGGELRAAMERKRALERAGASMGEVKRQILDLRRKLREGGQLREGDALGDDRYLLVEQVGRGGFGSVWKALDRERGDAVVAIKVLHTILAGDVMRRERFFRGARAMAALDHPAVVKVLAPEAEDGGFQFFVMEHVGGGDFLHAVTNGRLPKGEVLDVVLHVGEALALAHDRRIVHRDVKPANILLDEDRRPKLTDFDLVAVDDTTGGTRTGALGTLRYAAPESLDKPQDADARADVYGLGMTAVFGLRGSELPATVLRDAGAIVDRLDCDARVKAVLKRAVEWDRDKRYENARAFCAALGEARKTAEPVPHPPKAPTKLRRDEEAKLPSAYRSATPAAIRLGEQASGAPAALEAWVWLWGAAGAVGAVAVGIFVGVIVTKDRAGDGRAGLEPPADAATRSASAVVPASTSGGVPANVAPVMPRGCPAGMAAIPGGTFNMGSKEHDSEKPVHPVTVAGYCLDLVEVTVAAYKACAAKHDCTEEHIDEWNDGTNFAQERHCNYKSADKANHPINCVSWIQADSYCRVQGNRLPTEEEWEYAARGGDKQRTYPWGEDKPSNQLCWDGDGSDLGRGNRHGTCEVGKYSKGNSFWGVHDMAGNVWEWTSSAYCSYPESGISKNCSDGRRVLRGGAWYDDVASVMRAAVRYDRALADRSFVAGFRCARTPTQ